jgi:RHS repeat-associated protein
MSSEVPLSPDIIFCDGFESGTTDAWGAPGPSGTLIYTFDAADQLVQVEQDGQVLGSYAYDGDGLRVSATVGGETVYYLRNEDGNTLAEYDGSGALIAEYLYGNGGQIGKIEPDGVGGDNVSYFHHDHLGSTMLITNDDGAVTWEGRYEPFGEPVRSTGDPDRYRFTQHELDLETNLFYAKARYYNPRLGRFLSVDPVGGEVGSSQSWNRYGYVENNPLRLVDPNGLDVVDYVLHTSGPNSVPNTPHPEVPDASELGPQQTKTGGFFLYNLEAKFETGDDPTDYRPFRAAFILDAQGGVAEGRAGRQENPSRGQIAVEGLSQYVYDSPGLQAFPRARIGTQTFDVAFVAGEVNKRTGKESPLHGFYRVTLEFTKGELTGSTATEISEDDFLQLTGLGGGD